MATKERLQPLTNLKSLTDAGFEGTRPKDAGKLVIKGMHKETGAILWPWQAVVPDQLGQDASNFRMLAKYLARDSKVAFEKGMYVFDVSAGNGGIERASEPRKVEVSIEKEPEKGQERGVIITDPESVLPFLKQPQQPKANVLPAAATPAPAKSETPSPKAPSSAQDAGGGTENPKQPADSKKPVKPSKAAEMDDILARMESLDTMGSNVIKVAEAVEISTRKTLGGINASKTEIKQAISEESEKTRELINEKIVPSKSSWRGVIWTVNIVLILLVIGAVVILIPFFMSYLNYQVNNWEWKTRVYVREMKGRLEIGQNDSDRNADRKNAGTLPGAPEAAPSSSSGKASMPTIVQDQIILVRGETSWTVSDIPKPEQPRAETTQIASSPRVPSPEPVTNAVYAIRQATASYCSYDTGTCGIPDYSWQVPCGTGGSFSASVSCGTRVRSCPQPTLCTTGYFWQPGTEHSDSARGPAWMRQARAGGGHSRRH